MSSSSSMKGSRSRAREFVHPNMANAYRNSGVPSAIEIDGWIYLTGVIAAPKEGETDLEPAFRRAFEQLTEVLEMADSGWGDVIKITSFHQDAQAELPVAAKVKAEYLPDAPYPAWTVVGTTSLANPAGVCEIEVIARR